MRLLRPMMVVVLVSLILAACGGGSDQGGDKGSDQNETTAAGGASDQTTTAGEGSEGEAGSSPRGSAKNSINYSISGGYDAGGEASFVPSMSYFDSGFWTMAFGDPDDGISLLLYLDPATPSVNFTDGKATAAGDISQCSFDVTRQDASGASGSFACSDVPVVDSGALTQANNFSGTFDGSP